MNSATSIVLSLVEAGPKYLNQKKRIQHTSLALLILIAIPFFYFATMPYFIRWAVPNLFLGSDPDRLIEIFNFYYSGAGYLADRWPWYQNWMAEIVERR